MRHTFTAAIQDNKDANLYTKHIKVPVDIHKDFGDTKRIMCQINDNEPWHAAFVPMGDGSYFIITSKDTLKVNGVGVGDEVMVHLWPDESKYGMPICPEFEELLSQDPGGSALFHALTAGKIRSLLYQVNKYKSADKRIEKALIILEHLKANNGKLDYKMLNQAFKLGL